MGDFFIGETNFGVERKNSRFELKKGTDGRLLLTVEIRGDEKVYQEITGDENSEWSWTLYPPEFYLRDFPVSNDATAKKLRIALKPEDSDKFDVALYLMEHNRVDGVTASVERHRLEVAGRVDLMGELRDFRIYWER